MGKATRWLKGLFGIKKDKGQGQRDAAQKEAKWPEKLGHSGRDRDGDALCSNPNTIPPNITPAEAAWLKSFYGGSDSDKEQSKHAIAVAAATAAAADAAITAAQAAVAVVRLTSQGRGTMMGSGGSREKWAATRIQSVFRGFLARKALRALRSLVKLQALVRGYLVRKQAAATFESMQALIRAQVNIRANRIRSLNPRPQRTRQSMERLDESRNRRLSFSASFDSINDIPKIVEMDTGRLHLTSRSRRASLGPWEESPSSPCCCRNPPQLSSRVSIPESDWGFVADECRFSTAQSTPRLSGAAKSVCGESLFPNYMANTQSFNAKLRSLSAPKQRPEPGIRRRLSLHEMMESRSSLSGARMQRSCSQVQDVLSFKNAVVGSLGRSSDFARNHLYNHSQD